MNAAFEIANGALEAAKEGIDHPGTVSEAEIHALLDTSRRLFDRATQTAHIEGVQSLGKAALEELDQLEQIRRLLAYGIATGRTNADGMKLHALLEARPTISKTSDINAASKAFEWLGAHRREISKQLANVNPINQ
jgi:hypothetical protein